MILSRAFTKSFGCSIAIAVASAACGYATIDTHSCPPGGTTLTYANFGADFMTHYCQGCHGAHVTGNNRAGAPSISFDTVEDIRANRDRIFVRAAGTNDSMPPGPIDPPLAERNKLADWLACGAPE